MTFIRITVPITTDGTFLTAVCFLKLLQRISPGFQFFSHFLMLYLLFQYAYCSFFIWKEGYEVIHKHFFSNIFGQYLARDADGVFMHFTNHKWKNDSKWEIKLLAECPVLTYIHMKMWITDSFSPQNLRIKIWHLDFLFSLK